MNQPQIAKILRRQGVTRADLAERLGVKPPTIQKYLDGDPKLSTLLKIADAIGVHPAELLPQQDTPDSTKHAVTCPCCGAPLAIVPAL